MISISSSVASVFLISSATKAVAEKEQIFAVDSLIARRSIQ
jgi:hypothetical protein